MIVRGTHDDATIEQLQHVAAAAEHVALMADGHRGYYMPIGGVAAYDNKVSPHGVGVDIACGNFAVKLDMDADALRPHLESLADEIYSSIGFGMGQPTNPIQSVSLQAHPLFEDDRWDIIPPNVRRDLRQRARAQLGTVGGGNHYVDVFEDEEGAVWVGCHFGSRGLGYIISNGMIARAQGGEWKDLQPKADWNDPRVLDLDTQLGQDYMDLMELAGDYAYAGRQWAVYVVASLLGADVEDGVHNHHNFAWRETHQGRDLIVVRKGATPAFPGQRGFVGGSMGDISVILQGADTADTRPLQEENLYSTVHGAGRVMGRMQAKGKWKGGECVRPGRVSADDMRQATEGVVRRGGDLDEAPQVYRPLREVLDAQGGTITIEHTLQPLVVCMAPGRTGSV